MPKKNTFSTIIDDDGGEGTLTEIPFDVEVVIGSKHPKIEADAEEG